MRALAIAVLCAALAGCCLSSGGCGAPAPGIAASDDGLNPVPDSDSSDQQKARSTGGQRRDAFQDQAARQGNLAICPTCLTPQPKQAQ
jgi:hypothetical protein